MSPVFSPQLTNGGDHAGAGHSCRAEVIQSTTQTRMFATFAGNHYFAKPAIRITEGRLDSAFAVALKEFADRP